MKVLLFNGSPHPHGATFNALTVVAKTLQAHGITTEILQSGNRPIQDCIACGGCAEKQRCIFNDDCLNDWLDKVVDAAGFVFGTPVYYAHPSGRILSLLDRLFYAGGQFFQHKPAAVLATARRAGTLPALDALTKHLSFAQMPLVSSTYWPGVYRDGTATGLTQDAEGLETLRNLGENMAWLLKCLDLGRQNNLLPPPTKHTARTSLLDGNRP